MRNPDHMLILFQIFYNHGADAFIGNHPHVIQAVDKINDYIAAYCLGSISQTPDGEYRNNPLLPYYSMILHLEIDKLSRKYNCSYTPVRAVADQKRYIRIYPLTKLINERPELQDELLMDARFLHTRITNTETNEDLQFETVPYLLNQFLDKNKNIFN